MQKIEVTYSHTLRVWWSYVWRTVLFSAILGAVLGFIGGFIVGFMGRSDMGGLVGGVLGYLGSIPVSIWVFKKILNKKYKTFSVALVTEDNA